MGSRNSPFAGRGRATMLMVETSPARLGNVKASLKRSIDRDSLLVQEAGKVKKPRYAGTIFEAMLAPLAPSTTLTTPRPRPPPQPRGDPGLQADLADLVKLGKKDKMESWLEEHHECVNLNLYSSAGGLPGGRRGQHGAGEVTRQIRGGHTLVKQGRVEPGAHGLLLRQHHPPALPPFLPFLDAESK